ncbi:MAG: hypothetical protein EA364_13510 [Balneolaceae bacterium]|nr:MAG: hypothetical protein EA364_13510 [Balneolaceae bacterium]
MNYRHQIRVTLFKFIITMKSRQSSTPLLTALAIVVMVFAGCDTGDSVSGLQESLGDIPALRSIEGADNATITVNRNLKDSYFDITLASIAEGAEIVPGDYAAWCAQWDVRINSNNGNYSGVQVMDISDQEYWKEVVFLINEADYLMESDDDVRMQEIQVATWALIRHRTFNVDQSYLDRLGSEFSSTNLQAVLKIIKYVRDQAPGWNFRQMRKLIYYVQIIDEQDLIITKPKFEKGFGVRFKSFANTGSREIYLGAGDLGVGSNRSEVDLRWAEGANAVSFGYDAANDRLTASANGVNLIYGNLAANVAANTSCTIDTIDRVEVLVRAGHNNTTVQAAELVLGTVGSLTAVNGVSPGNQVLIEQDGLNISAGFLLNGTITLAGTFSGGDERSKVEILLGCPNFE